MLRMESSTEPEVVVDSSKMGGNSSGRTDGPETSIPDDAGPTIPPPSCEQTVGSDGLWPPYCNPAYRMPERIDVKVTIDSGETYFFPVFIDKATDRKVYLGGYRNKLNGAIYHHAATQTPSDRKKAMQDYSNLRTRETQTSETRTLSVQLGRESGTQMERIDLKLDNKRDKIKYPKPYFTADELMMKKKAAVVEIQRNWRGYMARSSAARIRQRNIDYEREQKQARYCSFCIYSICYSMPRSVLFKL